MYLFIQTAQFDGPVEKSVHYCDLTPTLLPHKYFKEKCIDNFDNLRVGFS